MTGGDTWGGQRLKALRAKKRLTQDELADQTGIARETMNKLENGKRPISVYYARKIAPVLGVRESALVQQPVATPLQPQDPLALLGSLSATVETMGTALKELTERVVKLEQKPAARRRGAQGA